ncbi:MAG TPA: WD40 repeat domain-containing protein, partial [Solirubrobacteraceae bacterium]|nr:WD40 repeat domain-containing protein [Solirubrobacteraceae bacterium]
GAQALDEPRVDVAALLAREAVALDRSPQTEGDLLSTLLRSPAVVATFALPTSSQPQVAVSPDGATLAVSDSVGARVQFYGVRTRTRRMPVLGDFLGDQPPVYSADGTLIAYSDGPELVVRDSRTLALLDRLPVPPPFSLTLTADVPSGSILIAPDQRTLYYAYWLLNRTGQASDAYLARWSLPGGRALTTVRISSEPLLALRLIDGGAELTVVTAHSVSTYDARTLRTIRSAAISPVPLLPSSAAISPDGRTGVIGSQNGSVWFVDAASGAATRSLGGHTAAVAAATYSPDGSSAITVGNDGRVIVWIPRRETERAVLSGPSGDVRNATISPDGSTLYTSGVGGVLLAWDLTGRRAFGDSARVGPGWPCCGPAAPPGPAMAISPDGSRFAAALTASTIGIFSTATLQRLTSIPADDPTALAWSPSGSLLAVGDLGGSVALWSVSGPPHRERSLTGLEPLPGQTESVQSVAFSPDGRFLAAADKDQVSALGHAVVSSFATMAIWRLPSGRLVAQPADLGTGNGLGGTDALAFSPDSKLLAATLLVGGIRIFDPATGRAMRTLSDPANESIALAFARDSLLAAGTLGGNVEMWNPLKGRRLGQPFLADFRPISSVAFDPSGQRFVTTGGQDGAIKLWLTAGLQQEGPRLSTDPTATAVARFEPRSDVLVAFDDQGNAFTWPTSLASWERRACSLGGRLTSTAWAQIVGGPRYASVCP